MKKLFLFLWLATGYISALEPFSFGEFIYWRYSSPGLSYGRTGISLNGVSSRGTDLQPDFKFEPGFKLGLGVKCGDFDVIGIYTYLNSNPKGEINGNPITSTFLPVNFFLSANPLTITYTHASLKLNIFINFAEIQSGYTFSVNPHLSLRPYFGLMSCIIKGELNANYRYFSDTFATYRTRGHCRSFSMGPKVGIDFTAHLTRHLGIYTNFNISQQITYAHLSTKAHQNSTLVQNAKLNQNRNIGFFALEIGPFWEQWFHKCHAIVRVTYGGGNLSTGANLTFLNNNNQDLIMNGEIHGWSARALLEF